jgi:hypothetical protein
MKKKVICEREILNFSSKERYYLYSVQSKVTLEVIQQLLSNRNDTWYQIYNYSEYEKLLPLTVLLAKHLLQNISIDLNTHIILKVRGIDFKACK